MLPAASTNRCSYSSGEADCTIQYARKPSPVNLSNHPPGVPIPLRTADTNLSMIVAKRSNCTASFISSVDSRMSAAITNICRGAVSMIASSSWSRSKRSSQSGGACASSRAAIRARSRSRSSPVDGSAGPLGASTARLSRSSSSGGGDIDATALPSPVGTGQSSSETTTIPRQVPSRGGGRGLPGGVLRAIPPRTKAEPGCESHERGQGGRDAVRPAADVTAARGRSRRYVRRSTDS